jgi:hypothetical protein
MSRIIKRSKPMERISNKKVSLKLKGGSEHVEEGGSVDVVGSCVVLIDNESEVVIAYCLLPGEIVRRVGKGEYAIEF